MKKTILKRSLNILAVVTLGLSIFVSGCSSAAKNEGAKENKKAEAAVVVPKDNVITGARNTPIVAAAKKVGPAVVGITNKAHVRDIFNRVQLTERGTGSGVIYDKSGLIATNNHVVE